MYLPRFNDNFCLPSLIPSLLLADSSDLDSSVAESAKCLYLKGMIISPASWQDGGVMENACTLFINYTVCRGCWLLKTVFGVIELN